MRLRPNFSLSFIVNNALATLKRFPMVIIASAAAGSVCNLLLTLNPSREHFSLNIALMALLLAIPLLVAASLVDERVDPRPKLGRAAVWAVSVILPASFYALAQNAKVSATYFLFAQLLLAAHLLVAIAPFWKGDEKNAFWQFNKTIFLRFLLSILYSGVLCLGVMLIYASLGYLFGIKFGEAIFRHTWLLCTFFFHPLHFLTGCPRDFGRLEEEGEYPRGLAVFTQYLLTPLLCAYVLVLSAYFLKIVFTWNWPQGGLGWMISSLSAVGIFTLLLIDPLTRRNDAEWSALFRRVFYALLIPLAAMMLLAVGRRIHDYGVSESRYFLMLFGAWSLAVALYFTLSAVRDIRKVPISLFLVTVASAFGPWSAYPVSLRSQALRLKTMLEKNGVMTEGKIRAKHSPLATPVEREMISIFDYLVERHGVGEIENWFPAGSLLKLSNEEGAHADGPSTQEWALRNRVLALAGLDSDPDSPNATSTLSFNFTLSRGPEYIELAGFKKMIVFKFDDGVPVPIGKSGYAFAADRGLQTWSVSRAGKTVMRIDLPQLVDSLGKIKGDSNRFMKPDELRIPIRSESFRAELILKSFSGTQSLVDKRVVQLNETEAFLLY